MLSDFGIAKILETDEATLTGSGVGIGTPEYMSPEQSMGRGVDQRTDIYALGMVFYELVTGRKAYTADTPAAVLIKQVTEPLPRPKTFVPDLLDEVELAIFKALAKNKRRLAVDPGERGFQQTLAKRYQQSLDVLLPIKQQLAMTDRLIDQIVYNLYGLTDEEIAIVEGRTSL